MTQKCYQSKKIKCYSNIGINSASFKNKYKTEYIKKESKI